MSILACEYDDTPSYCYIHVRDTRSTRCNYTRNYYSQTLLLELFMGCLSIKSLLFPQTQIATLTGLRRDRRVLVKRGAAENFFPPIPHSRGSSTWSNHYATEDKTDQCKSPRDIRNTNAVQVPCTGQAPQHSCNCNEQKVVLEEYEHSIRKA